MSPSAAYVEKVDKQLCSRPSVINLWAGKNSQMLGQQPGRRCFEQRERGRGLAGCLGALICPPIMTSRH